MAFPTAANVLILGYCPGAIDDLDQYIDMPKAPSNYGADAAKKWDLEKGAELRHKVIAEAAFSKLTGMIVELTLVDPQRQVMHTFSIDDPKNPVPSVEFVNYLETHYPGAFRAQGEAKHRVSLMAFDAKKFVRVSGWEAKDHGVNVDLAYWYQNECCFDPYEMAVEDTRRKSLPHKAVFAKLNIPCRPEWQPHMNSREDARLATELVFRRNLANLPGAAEQEAGQTIAGQLRLMALAEDGFTETPPKPPEDESADKAEEVVENQPEAAAGEEPVEDEPAKKTKPAKVTRKAKAAAAEAE